MDPSFLSSIVYIYIYSVFYAGLPCKADLSKSVDLNGTTLLKEILNK